MRIHFLLTVSNWHGPYSAPADECDTVPCFFIFQALGDPLWNALTCESYHHIWEGIGIYQHTQLNIFARVWEEWVVFIKLKKIQNEVPHLREAKNANVNEIWKMHWIVCTIYRLCKYTCLSTLLVMYYIYGVISV